MIRNGPGTCTAPIDGDSVVVFPWLRYRISITLTVQSLSTCFWELQEPVEVSNSSEVRHRSPCGRNACTWIMAAMLLAMAGWMLIDLEVRLVGPDL